MSDIAAVYRRSLNVDPARLPLPAMPLAPIGDIHGRLDLLDALLAGLPDDCLEVYLGDLIDRGPDSLGVLRRVRERQLAGKVRVALEGNHENMLKIALWSPVKDARGDAFLTWLVNGGLTVMAQLFPGEVVDHKSNAHAIAAQLDTWGPRIEEALRQHGVVDLLKGLEIIHWEADGRLAFVHAGLHPYIATDEFLRDADHQMLPDDEEFSPIWTRKPWMTDADAMPASEPALVVHGHTILGVPNWSPGGRRLSLDTGAYSRGRLTACIIGPDGVTLLQACEPGVGPTIDLMAVPECFQEAVPAPVTP